MPQIYGQPVQVKKPKPPKPVVPKAGAKGGKGGDISTKDFTAGTASGSSSNQVKGKRGVGDKGGTGDLKKDNPATGATSGPGTKPKPKPKPTFKKAFELEKSNTAPPQIRKNRIERGGGGTFGGDSTQRDAPTFRNQRDGRVGSGDSLYQGMRDRDLVGSSNTIDNFDGSTYGSSTDTEIVGGGGGGTGSSLQGREAVGRVGDIEGQSLEEVVYGVQKRGKKVKRSRSL